MRRKRRIWIFAVVLAMAAVQGTVFAGAGAQDVESSVEAMTETTKTEMVLNTTGSVETVKEQKDLPEEVKQISAKDREEIDMKKSSTRQVQKSVKKTADGQTLLDVSKGNITIKSSGATGGGVQAVRHL